MSRLFASSEFKTGRSKISLDGNWEFSYDPSKAGIKRKWHAGAGVLPERIQVPGCSQARRFSSAGSYDRFTGVALPEQSDTIMLRYGCKEDSWYRKSFTVPSSWRGQLVHLHVGGVKPHGEFWINGHYLGDTLSSRSPVRCDVSRWIRPGKMNQLVARVTWPKMRLDGMFDCLIAWSGLYRSIWLEKVPAANFTDVYAVPSVRPASATISFGVETGGRRNLKVICRITGLTRSYSSSATVTAKDGSLKIRMPGAKLWSPQEPNLYNASLELVEGDKVVDRASFRFGLREIEVQGKQVLLNGKPIFLRGACDDRIYPKTVCPPAEKAFYRGQIAKAKKYGFNYTKSCVEIYTEEYLQAADELGYLVCQEMPFGMVGLIRQQRDNPPADTLTFMQNELTNIVKASRNHTSVVAYSMASEQHVNLPNPKPFRFFSRRLPAMARMLAPGALIFDVTSTNHWSTRTRHGVRDTDLIEEASYYCGAVSPLHGKLEIPQEVDRPVILHEWNWICALPDPKAAERLARSPLYPFGIPEMIRTARDNGLSEAEVREMAGKSEALKRVLRKDALEVAFEHPLINGYHHWLIHDLPYCPEGIFDEFWKEPEGLSGAEFRTYNNETVLVLDDRDRRWFEYGGDIPLGVTVAHFGAEPLRKAEIRWRFMQGRKVVQKGSQGIGPVACGTRKTIHGLEIKPIKGESPRKLEFVCEISSKGKTIAWNHWSIWFFPSEQDWQVPEGVVSTVPVSSGEYRKPWDPLVQPANTQAFVTHRLHDSSGKPLEAVLDYLNNGGRVLFLSNGMMKEAESCFYRTVAFNQGKIGNSGTVIHHHPALGEFPHEGWCDLVCIPMLEGAYPSDLSAFKPSKIDPIIRSIGHYVTMQDKAYLFEARVGKGLFIAAGLNLLNIWGANVPARYLLHRLIEYIASPTLKARNTLTVQQIKDWLSRRP